MSAFMTSHASFASPARYARIAGSHVDGRIHVHQAVFACDNVWNQQESYQALRK